MATEYFTAHPIGRRDFLHGAGAAFLTSLIPARAEALSRGDLLFASAFADRDGRHGVALLTEAGQPVWQTLLPARGHGSTQCRKSGLLVVFARRPGTFALVIDPDRRTEPVAFSTPKGRHFYGHGAFSTDGRLLFAAENDFANAAGTIGIYDATGRFRRVGEFSSHGVGPHEITLMPDGRLLAVANGGIETHPQFGRAKLNIATMAPSLALIDSETGELVRSFALPAALHQLSIRHIDVTEQGTIVFGCQYEGSGIDLPPLVGRAGDDRGIEMFGLDDAATAGFNNYIGSVSIAPGGAHFAVSSPKGNTVAVIDLRTGEMLHSYRLDRGCGLAATGAGYVASSDKGFFGRLDNDAGPAERSALAFDNHITALARLPA